MTEIDFLKKKKEKGIQCWRVRNGQSVMCLMSNTRSGDHVSFET